MRLLAGLAIGVVVASCSQTQEEKINFPLRVQKERHLGTLSAALAVAWSPDGSKIAASINYGTEIVVWNSSGRQLSHLHVGNTGLSSSIAFVSGSSQILIRASPEADSDVVLEVVDATSGEVVRRVDGPKFDGQVYTVNEFRTAPDQRLAAVVMDAPYPSRMDVGIVDTSSWTFVRGYQTGISTVCLNLFGKGRRVVVGSVDGSVNILDPTSPAPSKLLQAGTSVVADMKTIEAVAGSPDAAFVFLGQAGTAPAARVFRVTDNTLVSALRLELGEAVKRAEWDPKGRYVAFLENDNNLVIWRPLATALSYEKIRLPNTAFAFAISPNGGHIAIAGNNGATIYSVR